jgi:hypothetical protein
MELKHISFLQVLLDVYIMHQIKASFEFKFSYFLTKHHFHNLGEKSTTNIYIYIYIKKTKQTNKKKKRPNKQTNKQKTI